MKHKNSYFVGLLIILFFGVFAIIRGQNNPTLQLAAGGVTSVCYVLWGIIYHLFAKDIHFKVVVEYLLIGVLAFVFLATIVYV